MQNFRMIIGLSAVVLSSTALAQDAQQKDGPLEVLDSNEDGVVDFVEFQENGRDQVTQLDSDGDLHVSLDEFLAEKPNRRGGPRGGQRELSDEQIAEFEAMMLERRTEQFTAMDLDGNGLVSAIELQEATFLRMDDDGDGVLSASELRRRGHGGPGRGGRRGGPGSRSGGQSPQDV